MQPQPLTVFTVLPRLVTMLRYQTFTTLFALAMATAGTALACFLGFHIQLIRRGMTTNEYYKWNELLQTTTTTASASASAIVTKSNGNKGSQQQQQQCTDINDDNDDVEECTNWRLKPCSAGRDSGSQQQFVNLYDRGLVSNFLEVCYPRCDRPLGKKRD